MGKVSLSRFCGSGVRVGRKQEPAGVVENLQVYKRIYAKRRWKERNTMDIRSDPAP
ncbi:MAG: hypothetical protein HFI45_05220 [Lachnospiraceae bacterium]|nr:hypothetical protein [Lachnospiraceae bacterium]